jgi:hypothetical protein
MFGLLDALQAIFNYCAWTPKMTHEARLISAADDFLGLFHSGRSLIHAITGSFPAPKSLAEGIHQMPHTR